MRKSREKIKKKYNLLYHSSGQNVGEAWYIWEGLEGNIKKHYNLLTC